jgi:uncharacterized protein YndB with AHSA1/START domain
MILKIILVIAVSVAAILIFAAAKPNTFHIQRSVIVQAPPDKIFPMINDLRNWKRWEPQDADPTMKRTFSGPDYGVGAASDWSGEGRTGAGRMTISESKPLQSVTIDVDWRRPFTVRNVNQFTLEPDGTGTRVTWSMYGPNVYLMKVMSVFTDMDRMMGKHFEEGLQNLKTVAEK